MSELIDIDTIVKPIEPIVLNGSDIGTNVNKRFDTIDDNFKKIITSDYLRGAPGDDIIIGSVTLENPGNDPAKNEGHELFNEFYKLIVGQNNNVDDADAKLIKKELHERQIMKIYSNSSSTGTQSFLGTYMPFVFKDPRLDQLDNVDTSTISQNSPYKGFTDYSCCIYYDNEKNKWVKLESMPNIYFDEESYQFCWKINGVETKLIAQGPAGPNGVPGSNVLLARIGDGCKEDIDENMDLVHDITHFFVYNEEDPIMHGKWIDVNGESWEKNEPLLVLNNNAATLAITRSIKDPLLKDGKVQYGVVYKTDKDGNIVYKCDECGNEYIKDELADNDECPKCRKANKNVICSPVPVKFVDSLHGNSDIVYVDKNDNNKQYSQYKKDEENENLLEFIWKIEYYWYLGILRLIEEDGKYSYSFVTSKDCLNDIFQNVLDNIYAKGEVNNFINNLQAQDELLETAITTEIAERQEQDDSLGVDISDIAEFIVGSDMTNRNSEGRFDLNGEYPDGWKKSIESSDPDYGDENDKWKGRNLLDAVNYKYDKSFINSKVGSMDYQIKRTNYNLSKYDILEPNIQVINMDALKWDPQSNPNPTVDIDLELNKLTRVILSDGSDELSVDNLIININLPFMETRKLDDELPNLALEEPNHERKIFPNYNILDDKYKWDGKIDTLSINPGIKYSINDYKWEDNWIYRTVTRERGDNVWESTNPETFVQNIMAKPTVNSTALAQQLWNELIYMTDAEKHLNNGQQPIASKPGVWDAAMGIYHTALQLPKIKNAVIKIMYKYSNGNAISRTQIYPSGVTNTYKPFGNDNVALNYYNRAYIAHNFKKSNIQGTSPNPIKVITEAPSEWIMTGYYEITKSLDRENNSSPKFKKNYRNIWNIAAAEYYSEPVLSADPSN